MSVVNPKGQFRLESGPAVSRVRPQTKRSVFQCLIVSGGDERRRLLQRSATRGGWRPIACSNVAAAVTQLERSLVQLAIVDLVGVDGDWPQGFRNLSEELAGWDDVLLAVCGSEGDMMEEIWARQLGAWLYLPGLTEGNSGDLTAVCQEALRLARQLTGMDESPNP